MINTPIVKTYLAFTLSLIICAGCETRQPTLTHEETLKIEIYKELFSWYQEEKNYPKGAECLFCAGEPIVENRDLMTICESDKEKIKKLSDCTPYFFECDIFFDSIFIDPSKYGFLEGTKGKVFELRYKGNPAFQLWNCRYIMIYYSTIFYRTQDNKTEYFFERQRFITKPSYTKEDESLFLAALQKRKNFINGTLKKYLKMNTYRG